MPSTRTTTISPSRASGCGWTTMRSASKMPTPIMESPRTRSTKSPSSRRRKPGTSTSSSTLSSARIGAPAATRPTSGRRTRRTQVADHVERTRLGRVALDEPEALEVGQVRVDGGRRGQIERRADLAHRGRIAVGAHARADELQYLLLSRCETLHRSSSCGEHVFVWSVERTRVRVKEHDRDGVGRKNRTAAARAGPARRRGAVTLPVAAPLGVSEAALARPDAQSTSCTARSAARPCRRARSTPGRWSRTRRSGPRRCPRSRRSW